MAATDEQQPSEDGPAAASGGDLEEEDGTAAKAPLLLENDSKAVDVEAPVYTKSPKRQTNGQDAAALVSDGELELEAPDPWDKGGSSSRRGAGAGQRRGRQSTPDWCSLEEMCHEFSKLLYAPNDLWIVYTVKLAECTAYYGFSYVYTHYLTEEYGMGDQEAGNVYALYGLLCFIIGILMGVSIDRLGVRRSLILGCICSTAARAMMCLSRSPFICYLAALVVAPVGAGFGVPALALGVRRFTHPENRSVAFSVFYAVLCFACLLGSLLINRLKHTYHDGTDVLGYQWSWMRIVAFWATLCSIFSLIASCFVRDIQVLADQPLEDCAYEVRRYRVRTSMREILEQRRFWRLVGITFIFCGVRMTFRHLDATFPKYFMRTHGEDAPFEMILGIQPLITMVITPIAAFAVLKSQMRLDQTLLAGAFISGSSVFILAADETYTSALLFVCVLALGEAIWSPKLYEFSTMAAPEGREGVYVAMSFAPQYLASVPVGAFSGWALSTFCARKAAPEDRHGQMMWFFIGLTTISSFFLLCVFRRRLFPREDDRESEASSEEEDSL